MKSTAFAVCIAAFAAIALVGCRNTGTYAVVGELDAPVDISDGSDTLNIRALFSLTGAKVWSARDTRVKMTYTNCYTNCYLFGMVEKRGRQDFGVEVDPTVDEAEETSVTCANGNCTISDGTISEVCEDCCIDGGCNPK